MLDSLLKRGRVNAVEYRLLLRGLARHEAEGAPGAVLQIYERAVAIAEDCMRPRAEKPALQEAA